jgi:hypothetical protein
VLVARAAHFLRGLYNGAMSNDADQSPDEGGLDFSLQVLAGDLAQVTEFGRSDKDLGPAQK